jgi:Dolichyl-phosphate-mannose-protein mannosyltransferase
MPVLDYRSLGTTPPPRTPLTDGFVKNRHVFWIVLAVFYLFAFNGQWRVGRDSALYRGLGHSLATGRGYVFGEFSANQVHRGLPLMLAGLEKLFGPADLPPILLIHLMSLGCLFFTYKLVRLHYPEWVAVIVTFAVGINGWFMELSEEMLTDIPFLLGMLAALYGWERIRTSDRDSRKPWPLVCLFAGVALAAFTRPTIWVLAAAWIAACLWSVAFGPRRKFHAVCLGLLAVLAMPILLARGVHVFSGGYEQDALTKLHSVAGDLAGNLKKMLGDELAYGFFGQKWIWYSTHLMDALAILASLLLWKKNPLWTLLILFTVIVTVIVGPVPRYYAMVLPLMALAWVVLIIEIATRVPHRWLEVALLAGLAALVIPNVVRCGKVIGEQHHWNNRDQGPPWEFVKSMSEQVRTLVPPGEKVIAPGASIMGYLSGREVLMQRDILPAKKSEIHWPEHIAALNIHYAVFPSKLYKEGERRIRELMDKGVIVPTERIARDGDMALMKIEISVPPPGEDWRKRPVTTMPVRANTTVAGTKRPTPAQLAHKHHQVALARKALAQHKAAVQAKQKKLAQLERQKKKQAAARAAAKKRHKARATQPAAATKPAAATTRASALLPLRPGEDWGEGERRSIPVRPLPNPPPEGEGIRRSFSLTSTSADSSASRSRRAAIRSAPA